MEIKLEKVLEHSENIKIYHLIGMSEFTDTNIQTELNNYIIIDTKQEDINKCIKSIKWMTKHIINTTIIKLIK